MCFRHLAAASNDEADTSKLKLKVIPESVASTEKSSASSLRNHPLPVATHWFAAEIAFCYFSVVEGGL
jgi:hypothetical protein